MTDTLLKTSFSEYTEAEFIKLLPAGSDLIYYPEPGADSSPEGVTLDGFHSGSAA